MQQHLKNKVNKVTLSSLIKYFVNAFDIMLLSISSINAILFDLDA